MPTQNEIIQALTLPHIYSHTQNYPMNTSADASYVISYNFEYANIHPVDDIWDSYAPYAPWSTAKKNLVRTALSHIQTFLNVTFQEVSDTVADAMISFGIGQLDSLDTYTSGISSTFVAPSGSGPISYWDAYAVYDSDWFDLDSINLVLHEIGHALGLDHPFDATLLDPAYDNNHYTVMSYDNDPMSGTRNNAMMLYDIYALQYIWGAADYATGNSTYNGAGSYDVRVVWDTGGTDTFDASAITHAVTLDLREAHFSTFGSYQDVAIAYGVNIENAEGGSGDDTIFGNPLGNILTGHAGNDIIRGGAGNDTLNGIRGRDHLYGQAGDDTLFGGVRHDLLRGGAGSDILHGGQGRDTLRGGYGDDVLYGDTDADKFVFRNDGGNDIIVDFEDNIDLLKVVGHGTLSEVLAVGSDVGLDVVFDFGGGNTITVQNMTLANLQDDISVA